MARKPKSEAEKPADPAGADASAPTSNGSADPKPKAKAAASKPKKKSAAPRKKPALTASSDSGSAPAPKQITEPSDDEIRLRAYFLAERRMRLSLPGDSAHDWIEARRQLLEEAGQ